MPGPTDLWAAADELLLASAQALDTIPVYDPTLVGAPDRQFVDFSLSALDCCDQLTVVVNQVLSGSLEPGGNQAGRQTYMRLNHVYFAVTISRCVPMPADDGTPPSIADMIASSKQLDADGWALWEHLYHLWTADLLFTFCDELFWDSLRPIGPSGGCAGWVLQVHTSLDGYPEAVST
ncbi:MAG TPA: hypothetical protein VGF24_37350 [Vicinamibacterales bacterium]|jgi:hypothetical protein